MHTKLSSMQDMLRLLLPESEHGRLCVHEEAIEEPNWEDLNSPFYRGIHDWRKYVPKGLRESWSYLDLSAIVTAYCMAWIQADAEEYD